MAPVLISIVFLMLVGISIIDKLKRAQISRCFMSMNKLPEAKQEQKPAAAVKRIERLKLNTNSYYSNKYGLREDLIEVIIYYDKMEFVLDDNTSYYLRKEMFYFIQNYLDEVKNRFVKFEQIEDEKMNKNNFQNMIRQQNSNNYKFV